MKIRLGFVSNSSSASYFITLKGKMKDINTLLIDSFSFVTWDDTLITRIEENILRTKTSIKHIEEKTDSFIYESLEELTASLVQLEKDKDYMLTAGYLTESYDSTITDIILRTYGVSKTEEHERVVLSHHTVMHNTYIDGGLSKVLQELVMVSAFENYYDVDINFHIEKE